MDDYQVNGGSVGWGQNGTTFTVTISAISDATVAALDGVVQNQGTIRLYSCGHPLLFALVTVERKDPRGVRIAGRIVGGVSYAKGAA